MRKILYAVSTYYHALISCVKQLLGNDTADIICMDYIPSGELLSDKIRKSGIFDKTFYVGKIEEYKSENIIDYVLLYHKKNAKIIEKQFLVSLDGYDEINIFHDDTWFAHYLKDKNIKYRLIEDALDSFKTINESNFAFMVRCNPIKLAIKRSLNIGYVFCGYDKRTVEVEVNDVSGLEIERLANGKLVEKPRIAMFGSLSDGDITILKNIFLKDIPTIDAERSVLLLTQPLFTDRIVDSEEKQVELYKTIVRKVTFGEQLVIKPHPRDLVDYSVIFPEAILIDKNMPLEILGLAQNAEYHAIVSISSTAMNFLKAKNYFIMKDMLEEQK